MDTQLLLTFHLVADIILCMIILFLIRKVSKGTNRGATVKTTVPHDAVEAVHDGVDQKGALIGDSYDQNRIFDGVPDAVTITKIETESNAGKRSGGFLDMLLRKRKAETPRSRSKYQDAIRLAEQGLSQRAIAKTVGLSEGEISLLMELNRTRNEGR